MIYPSLHQIGMAASIVVNARFDTVFNPLEGDDAEQVGRTIATLATMNDDEALGWLTAQYPNNNYNIPLIRWTGTAYGLGLLPK